jgi:hypothetical protein
MADVGALATGAVIASPVLAFVGAIGGSRIASRADDRLDRWRRREETMRMVRWAAELAISESESESLLGVAALDALRFSELLQPADYDLVDRVTEAVAGGTLDEVADAELVIEEEA